MYDQQVEPDKWYSNYIRTYIERDVRQLKNITDLNSSDRFLGLCAGRTDQLLDIWILLKGGYQGFLSFKQYPEPGSNRHSIAATGV